MTNCEELFLYNLLYIPYLNFHEKNPLNILGLYLNVLQNFAGHPVLGPSLKNINTNTYV